jgi:hypothetical protein
MMSSGMTALYVIRTGLYIKQVFLLMIYNHSYSEMYAPK